MTSITLSIDEKILERGRAYAQKKQTPFEQFVCQLIEREVEPSAAAKESPHRRTRIRKSKNPNNPSPSGDPFFDDPRNMAEIMEGIRQYEAGEVISLDDDEELQAIFKRCRQK